MTSNLPSYFVIAKEGGPGSVSGHTTSVVRALARGGYPVTVLTTRPDVIDKAVADLPVTCAHRILPETGPFLALYRQWSGALARFGADRAILIRGYGGTTPLPISLAIRRRFARVYAIEHAPPDMLKAANPGTNFTRRGGLAERVRDGLMCHSLYRSITVSQAVRQRMIELYHFNPAKICACQNWTDTDRFVPDLADRLTLRREIGAAQDEWVVGYVGRLSPEKRVDLIVRGFANFAADFAGRTRLLIVGAGPEEPRLRALVEQLGIAEKVQLTGFRPAPERWHRALDIELLASQFEGYPLSILEAMACKTIPLVHVIGGMPETVADGVNGFIRPIDEPDAITAGLKQITALPPDRLADIRQRARATIVERFSVGVGLSRLMEGLDAPEAAKKVREEGDTRIAKPG